MPGSRSKPRRVLHVVGGMDPGGVQTWLMHVLRRLDHDRFQLDFLVHSGHECAYDAEIRSLGSRIIPCLYPSRPWAYAGRFRRILREGGPYDVVHSHVHYYSGYVLRLADAQRVSIRIAHSHNDTTVAEQDAPPWRRAYLALAQRSIRRHATACLAASQPAASELFGPGWEDDRRCRVLRYGIDLEPFRIGASVQPRTVRAELGLPANAFVLGHVGRFHPQKNHSFLLDVYAEVLRCEPLSYLLLVGDGPLRRDVELKAGTLGLSSHVIFAGQRFDVPRLMVAAMDVLVLPSLYEGLGLVLIEAQAAGLPCVLADTVPEEADVIPRLMDRRRLDDSPAAWADAVLAVRAREALPKRQALTLVAESPFNILNSIRQLEMVYGD